MSLFSYIHEYEYIYIHTHSSLNLYNIKFVTKHYFLIKFLISTLMPLTAMYLNFNISLSLQHDCNTILKTG